MCWVIFHLLYEDSEIVELDKGGLWFFYHRVKIEYFKEYHSVLLNILTSNG